MAAIGGVEMPGVDRGRCRDGKHRDIGRDGASRIGGRIEGDGPAERARRDQARVAEDHEPAGVALARDQCTEVRADARGLPGG